MEDYSFFLFKYEFESGTGSMEGHRYMREFNMQIYAEEDDKPNEKVGKVRFKIIYIDQAINTGYAK